MKKSKEIYDLEHAYKNLENINMWINNSDTKSSIMLGLVGVVFTILFSNLKFIDSMIKVVTNCCVKITFSDLLYLLMTAISLMILFSGIYMLIRVLIPKLKLNINNNDSVIYFGSIGKYESVNDFKGKALCIKKEELLDDLLNQIYINSKICMKKFNNYNVGIRSLIVGIISFVLLYLIGLFIYL